MGFLRRGGSRAHWAHQRLPETDWQAAFLQATDRHTPECHTLLLGVGSPASGLGDAHCL